MLYQLEQGPTEKIILDQVRKQHLPLPDKIKNAPHLLPGLDFYMSAFQYLSTERPVGMSIGHIPWSSMIRYANKYKLNEDEEDRFVYLLMGLDMEYIKHVNKESERKTNAIKAKGQSQHNMGAR